MKKTFWLIFFFLNLAAHLSGIYFAIDVLQVITKPLIVIFLVGYFLTALKTQTDPVKKWILAALFFSWAGDILLIFQPTSVKFFLAGLVSFLFAHIFYIIFFHIIRIRENIKSKWLLLLIVVIYYGSMISFLSPYLNNLKLPVRIYGAFISFMFMLAMYMLFIKNKSAGRWMMIGALLFLISDSVLAINKFYLSFEWSGIIIMLTYGLAQLFIALGAIDYVRKNNSI